MAFRDQIRQMRWRPLTIHIDEKIEQRVRLLIERLNTTSTVDPALHLDDRQDSDVALALLIAAERGLQASEDEHADVHGHPDPLHRPSPRRLRRDCRVGRR